MKFALINPRFVVLQVATAGLLLATPAPVPAQTPAPAAAPTAKATAPKAAQVKPVELNSASKKDLMKLPGVNAALADKIIANRPYLTKTALVTRQVMSFSSYQVLRTRVYVIAKLPAKP